MKRFGKKLSALLVTAAMAATMALPAMAEPTAYAPVAGEDQTLTKYLVMDEEVSVPDLDCTFTIAPGSAVAGSADTLAVFAGNDANRTNGQLPQLTNAEFNVGDATATTTTAFTLPAGKKVATSTFDVKFSGVQYKEPGVYRYILTETTAVDGVTNDTNGAGTVKDSAGVRTIDVYVEHNAQDALEVTGYVVYEGNVTAVPTEAGSDLAAKSTMIIDEYSTVKLTLSKAVSGNQASRDEYFEFTLNISGAAEGTVYPVDLTNADATTGTNGVNTQAQTNPASITVGSDGTATATFWLQGGQSVVVKGLASGTKYTVAEDAATVIAEGYDISAAVTGDTDAVSTDVATDGTVSDTNTGITEDTTVAYTNTKQGTIPTGVLLTMAPVIVVGVIVVAGLAFFAVRSAKRKAIEAAEADADSEE